MRALTHKELKTYLDRAANVHALVIQPSMLKGQLTQTQQLLNYDKSQTTVQEKDCFSLPWQAFQVHEQVSHPCSRD